MAHPGRVYQGPALALQTLQQSWKPFLPPSQDSRGPSNGAQRRTGRLKGNTLAWCKAQLSGLKESIGQKCRQPSQTWDCGRIAPADLASALDHQMPLLQTYLPMPIGTGGPHSDLNHQPFSTLSTAVSSVCVSSSTMRVEWGPCRALGAWQWR